MFVVINMFGLLKEDVKKFVEDSKYNLENIIFDVKEKHYETYVSIDSSTENTKEFEEIKNGISEHFAKNIYGENERNIYSCAFEFLKRKNKTLALAESCTAGRISSEFVANNEGASAVLIEDIVCYSVKSKCYRFGIDPSFFETNSPQSFECSKQLAHALLKQSEPDVAIAVTGYASSISESPENGDAYITIALGMGTYTQRVHFKGTRNHIMQQISKCAFMFMLKLLNQIGG